MPHRVVSTSPTFGLFAREPVDYLEQHDCELKVVPNAAALAEDELAPELEGAEALIVGVEKITQAVLERVPTIKIIAKHGAGVDNIDMPAASARSVAVVSAAGVNSDAVADLTFGLFLALARSIPAADRQVRTGSWPRMVGCSLRHKTLGIVGFGQIGRKVAKRAVGFDMKVLAADVREDRPAATGLGARYVSMDDLLAGSDFVSIHVPLTGTTTNLVGATELAKMRRSAFLVNVSRGNVVDENALYDALKDGVINGAALDVFASEPVGSSRLFELENVIVTPHIAGYTAEALRDTGMVCVKGIVDFLTGKSPAGIVNPHVLTTPRD